MSVEFDLSIAGPALVAGALVLSTHIPLGRRVLERGIIFIDLAIAQVAGTGVVLADNLGWEANSIGSPIAPVYDERKCIENARIVDITCESSGIVLVDRGNWDQG